MTWFFPFKESQPSKSPSLYNQGQVSGENRIIREKLIPAVKGAEEISVIGGIAFGILGYQAIIFLSKFF